MSKYTYKWAVKTILILILTNVGICGIKAQIIGTIDNKSICCINDSISITANCTGASDLLYKFSVGSTIVQAYSTEKTTKVKMENPGSQNITVEVYSAADPTSLIALKSTIEVKARPTINAGADALLCDGESAVLGMTAENGVIYKWSPEQGLENPQSSSTATTSDFSATPATGITYTLTASVDGLSTCYSKDEVNVTMYTKPTADPGIDRMVCEGTAVELGMTPIYGVNYNWAPASVLENSTIANPKTLNLTSTVSFTMTASLEALPRCKSSASVNIEVAQIPKANAGSDMTICEGNQVRIGSTEQNNTSYSWIPVNYLENSSIANPITKTLSEGTYAFTLTTASTKMAACASSDEVIVSVKKKPVAYAGQNTTICKGTSISLGREGEAGVSYSWAPQIFDDYTIANPTTKKINNTTEFTLTASLTDLPSCASTSKVKVTIKENPIVFAGRDTTICEMTSARLGKESNDTDITYIWTPSIVSDPNIASPTTNELISTSTFVLTGSSISTPTCTSTDTVVVTIIPNAEKKSVTGGNYYCVGGDLTNNIVTLENSAKNIRYALFKNDTQLSEWVAGTGLNITWDRLSDGTYTVYGKNEIGCITDMSGSATISKYDLPTAQISATPEAICSGNEVTVHIALTGIPPFTFTLENSNGEREEITTNLSSYEIKAMPLANTTWRILKLSDYRCENSFKDQIPEASITLNTLPTTKIKIDDKKYVCKGSPIKLMVDFPSITETYKWSTGETSSSITVSPIITSTYYLTTINDKGCQFIDQVEIAVRELPEVSIAGLKEEQIYCSNEDKILLTGSPAGGQFAGSGIEGDYFNPANAIGIGTIIYEYTDIYGCKNDSVANVYVNPAPEVEFTIPALEFGAPYKKKYTYCSPPDQEIKLQGIPKIDEGKWTLHSANPNELQAEIRAGGNGAATLINCGPGTYTIEYSYTDNKNCTSSILKQLEINVNEPEVIDMGEITSLSGDTLCSLSTMNEIKADLTGGVFTVNENLLIDQTSETGLLRIDPSKVTAPSNYGIGYTFIDIKGCPHNLYKELYVTTPVNVRAINIDSSYCEYDPAVSFYYSSYINFPTKGSVSIIKNEKDTVWSNEQIETNIPVDGQTIVRSKDIQFKPQWGSGEYTITYQYADAYCDGIPYSVKVNVHGRPKVEFTMPVDYCYLDTITLSASPSGGLFTMAATPSNITYSKEIDTRKIGSGKQTLYYEYKDDYGCVNRDTTVINVNGVESVKILNLEPEYCENAGEITISAYPTEHGKPTFSTTYTSFGFLNDMGDGHAKIDLSKLNFIGTYNITYNYAEEYATTTGTIATCNMKTTEYFKVLGKNADFTGYEDKDTICGYLESITLIGNQEGKGSFTLSDPTLADGLKDNGNGTATLYPNKLIEKEYSITYKYDHYNDAGDLICGTEKTKSFYISPIKEFDITTDCKNNSVGIQLSGSESNAIYILYVNAFAHDTIQGTGAAIEFKPFTGDAYCKIYAKKRGCILKFEKELRIKPMKIGVEKSDISCYNFDDGKATAVVSDGIYPYDFTWTNRKGFSVKDSFAISLKPGKYYFEVTDAIGCTHVDSVNIKEPDTLAISIDETNNPPCAGESTGYAKAIVSGGVPNYTYEWKNLNTNAVVGTRGVLSNIESGSYVVSVTDKNGCIATDRATLVQNEPLKLTIDDIENNMYYGEELGSISTTVTGGAEPYTYLWKGISITDENSGDEDLKNLHAGNYFLLITDANGCTIDTIAIVTQPEELTVVENITNLSCYGNRSGAIDLSIKGGQPEFTFLWTGENGFTSTKQNITALDPGIYNVKITDKNGKIYRNSYEVKEPRSMVINTLSITDTVLKCNEDSLGIISIDVIGGLTPYNIEWTSSSISAWNNDQLTYEKLPADNYFVKITDANGCSVSRSYEITEPTKINVTGSAHEVSCPDKNDGVIIVNSNGGILPHTYFWTGGNSSSTLRNQSKLAPGNYYLTVTDYNGCKRDTMFNIKAATQSAVTLTSNESVCFGDSIEIRFDFTGIPNWNVSYTNGTQNYNLTSDITPTILKVLPKSNTTYSIIGASDGNHCNAEYTSDATIKISPTPEITLINSSANVCLNDSVEVEIYLQQGSTWNIEYKDGESTKRINNITSAQYKFKIKPSKEGPLTYEITSVENEYCKKDVHINFSTNVHGYPTVNVTAPSYVCQNEESAIKVEFAGEAPWTLSYYQGDQTKTAVFTEQTSYIKEYISENSAYQFYSVSSGFGCKKDIDKRLNVEVGKLPGDAVSVIGSTTACKGSTLLYSTPVIANATSYYWTLPDGVSFAGGTGSNVVMLAFSENAESGLITVQGKNDCGIGEYASIFVRVPKVVGRAGSIYADAEVCKNSEPIKISTSIIENADTYIWELPAGFNITFGDSTPAIIAGLNWDAQPGSIKVYGKNQCHYSDTIYTNIKILSTPSSEAGPTLYTACENSIKMEGRDPSPNVGTWKLAEGRGIIAEPHNPNTTITDLGYGSNKFYWTVSNGKCTDIDSTIINNVNVDMTQPEFYKLVTCSDTLTIKAKEPAVGTGEWTQVGGNGAIEQTGATEAFISGISMTTSTYRWRVYNENCSKDTIIIVQSNSPSQYAYAGADTIVTKDSMILSAKFNIAEVDGAWSIISGEGMLEDKKAHNSYIRNLTPGQNVLRWTTTYKGCTAYDEVDIYYVEEPIAGLSSDMIKGCSPLQVTFSNKTIGDAKFFWNFGDSTPIITDAVPAPHVFGKGGLYEVKLIAVGENKTDSATIQIEVIDAARAEFKSLKDTIFLPSAEVRFINQTIDGFAYKWDFGDGGSSIEMNPTHVYTEQGLYNVKLTVVDIHGCTSDSIVSVYVANMFIVYPNAFIPDIDHANGGEYTLDIADVDYRSTKVFYPIWKGVDTNKEYTLQIFNRWGALVYQSKDLMIGWDGYIDGDLAPQGIYMYKAVGSYADGKGFTMTGEISLIR